MRKKEKKNFYKMIDVLNKTTTHLITYEDNNSVIKNFTDESIKILNADFGFVRGKFTNSNTQQFIYKSSKTPYNPTTLPQKKQKYALKQTENLLFDSKVKKENYNSNIERFMKSYIIISIHYGDHVYGSIVLCYQAEHNFSKEELTLAEIMGNSIAYIITINWLLEKEQGDLEIAQKQKETEILLSQEKMKTEFIANATHELRTPLAIMRGNADLALEFENTRTPQFQERALKAIRNEIVHLSEILNNLAILTSKNGHHKNVLHLKKVDLISLIQETIKRLQVLLHKKKITVKIIAEKTKQIFITGDKEYLEKLFLNLIRNAITYGKERGKIIISLKKGNKKVIIELEDNGIGISKEDLPHIFKRFYRSEQARMTTKIGTGLGLAIVKWVTEMHGGTITAKSVTGKGSIFSVVLPIMNQHSRA